MEQDEKYARALVLSTSTSPCAYDIVRALARKGIRTAVASSDKHDIAFSSRYCTAKLVVPELHSGYDQTILDMLETFAQRQPERPVLYYVSDPELRFVERHRERLARGYRFLLPARELYSGIMNKAAFVSLARKLYLPAPETFCVSTIEELRSVLLTIPLPCIVKPAYSEDWIWETEEQQQKFGPYKKALRRFTSREEVEAFCNDLPFRSAGFLIQSYVDGRDERIVSFHGYFDESGTCLAHFLGRKIRTYPPHTGGSVYVETFDDPSLARQSIESLQRMQFHGIVKIDYKWDNFSQEYKILEINPRYNLWQLLGAYTGTNLAYVAYRSQRNEPLGMTSHSDGRGRLLYLKQDLRAFLDGYKRSSEWSFTSYVRSLRGKKYYRVFDSTDPLPFLVSLVQFIFRNGSRLIGLKRFRRFLRRRFRGTSKEQAEHTFFYSVDLFEKEHTTT